MQVPEAGLPQDVALPRGRIGAGGRNLECVLVEPHGARAVELRAPRVRVADDVVVLAAAARTDAGDVHRRSHVERHARLRLEHATDVPVSEHALEHPRSRHQLGRPVGGLGDQHVRPVEGGDAVVAAVVVGVRQDLEPRAAVVLRLRPRIGDRVAQAAGGAARHLQLHRVVRRLAGGLVQRDVAEAFVGAQRVGVHARVPLDRARLQLVDVARPLEVRGGPANIGKLHRVLQRHLPIRRDVPRPRARVGVVGREHGHHERERPPRGASRCIHVAVDHRGHLRQGRIEPVGRARVDLGPVQEAADAAADRPRVAQAVGHPEPRLQAVLRVRREARRQVVIQPPEVGKLRKELERLVGGAVARQDDTVERIAAARHDRPVGTVDRHGTRGIVELRLERRDGVVLVAPLLPQRVAQAELDGQITRRLPAVLPVEVVAHADEVGQRLGAELRVVVEQPEQRVGHGEAAAVGARPVGEAERAVLIGGRRGRGGAELDLVLHAGPFHRYAALERVVALDLRHAVGPQEHEVVPVARILVERQRAEALNRQVRQLLGIELRVREQERIIQAGRRARRIRDEIRAARTVVAVPLAEEPRRLRRAP